MTYFVPYLAFSNPNVQIYINYYSVDVENVVPNWMKDMRLLPPRRPIALEHSAEILSRQGGAVAATAPGGVVLH